MSFGIALAGGGCRGAAHVGVLAALEENKLVPSSLAGCSSGSIVASLYACGYSAAQLRDIIRELSTSGCKLVDVDVLGIFKAIFQLVTDHRVTLPGLIKGKRLEKLMAKYTGNRQIKELSQLLVIPAVNICTGKTIAYVNNKKRAAPRENVEWCDEGTLAEIVRASSAVPVIFQPKQMGKQYFVDGGTANVLPVDLLIAAGERNVLAVDISEEYHTPYPDNFVEIGSHSLSIMSKRLLDCVAVGERYTLHPDLPEEAGLLSFDKMEECMEIGYEETVKAMPILRMLFT